MAVRLLSIIGLALQERIDVMETEESKNVGLEAVEENDTDADCCGCCCCYTEEECRMED
jgi:hypothetical protein